MRTVVVNREDMYPKPVEKREKRELPVHENYHCLKNGFYEPSNPSGVRFVEIPDEEKSEYIEELFKEFCDDK